MKRRPDESFRDYQKRRKIENLTNKKIRRRGFLRWNSSEKGTYVEKEQGNE
jgi:hypothetical protein